MRNIRARLIRVVAIALALTAAAGNLGCAPPNQQVIRPTGDGLGVGGGPTAGRRSPLERTMRAQIAEAERFLGGQIAAGHLSPESVDEVRGREPAILAAVHRAEADGVVTAQERSQLDQMLRDAVDRGEQRLAMPRPWPGGAAYWR